MRIAPTRRHAAGDGNVPAKPAQWIEWNLTTFLQAQKIRGQKRSSPRAQNRHGRSTYHFQFAECATNQPQLVVTQAAQSTQAIVSPPTRSRSRRLEQFVHSETRLRPSSDVVVTIENRRRDLTSSINTLTFTSVNWNVAQTVNISRPRMPIPPTAPHVHSQQSG